MSYKALFWVSLALYVGSMFLPGYVSNKQHSQADTQEQNYECQHDSKNYPTPQDVQTCLDKVIASDTANTGPAEISLGYQILELGWIGILAGIVAWYGNLLYWIALGLSFGAPRGGLVFSVLSFLVGLTAFAVHSYDADEGGVMEVNIHYLGAGFYVWLASFVVLGAFCYLHSRHKRALKSVTNQA